MRTFGLVAITMLLVAVGGCLETRTLPRDPGAREGDAIVPGAADRGDAANSTNTAPPAPAPLPAPRPLLNR